MYRAHRRFIGTQWLSRYPSFYSKLVVGPAAQGRRKGPLALVES